MKILVTIIIVLSSFVCNAQTPNEMMQMLGKAPNAAAFEQDGYWVWGGSVLKAEDGRYHMFVARWPKHLTFHPGWMIASDIVHASADTPNGPFKFEEVALPARGAEYWDGRSTFNPKILKYKDTYVLFYTGSTHPFEDFSSKDTLKLNSKYSIVGRSNKRIGIAYSKNINGPWKRLDHPILETKNETFYSFLTSNPAPWINEDGSVVLLFKSRKYNKQFPYHSNMKIGVATAPSFKGPYAVAKNEPIFGEGSMPELEDPTLWKDEHGYHVLAKDQRGEITGHIGHGILAHSPNGIEWELDKNPYAYSKTVKWEDGSVKEMGQLERVSVLLDEKGKVSHIYFATMDGPGGFNNSAKSWNIVIPIKQMH